MAGGDFTVQQLPQRRRVVDFVRLLGATEKTLQQGVLARAGPGDRAYVLELNRLNVVRGRGVVGRFVLVGSSFLSHVYLPVPLHLVLAGLAGAIDGAAQPGPGRGGGAQDTAGLQLSRGHPGTHLVRSSTRAAAVQGHGRHGREPTHQHQYHKQCQRASCVRPQFWRPSFYQQSDTATTTTAFV